MLIAGAGGAVSGGLCNWLMTGYLIGGIVFGAVFSIGAWLILVHWLRPPSWTRTVVIALLSVPVQSLFCLGIPIGVFVEFWYITFPGALATAACMHVLVRISEISFDYCACVACGYNLTGNVSGVCPECGTSIPSSALYFQQPRSAETKQPPEP
jgi:hypothetical protein